MLALLTFEARHWLIPALAGAALACLLVAISYVRAPIPPRKKLACAALKLLGILALLACFLEPVWTSERPKPGANKIALVADNSESLRLLGRGETEPRSEALRRAVTGAESDWRQQLKHTFDLHSYLCDSRLQPTADFHELNFSGHASRLGQGLKTLTASFHGQPLAGIILLTDGAPTDLRAEDLALEGVPPIYPVVFGHEAPERDLAIAGSSVSQTSFEDAPVTIQAEVMARGFAGQEITATLTPEGVAPTTSLDPSRNETPAPAISQTLSVPGENAKVVFRFQLRPEKVGTLFYRLHLEGKTTAPAAEATAANNDTIITVERKRGPYRILYVSGRPNWEFKFLNRAIAADDQTQLVGLIRIARREPKFEFRGRSGESSNPLFRGFGNQSADEVERYDQPVLVRLNTRDETELRGGFPKTPEELFGYHAIIIDDVEAEFFTPDQMALVQRFVGERGGGLLMLGGMESFAEGKFARTPIGDLLPVYLNRAPEPVPSGAELRLALTREGWLQPWVRLRANEAEDRQRLGDMPPLELLNPVSGLKPGATVLASALAGQKEYPALATQRFGRGRSAALLIGDLYQSGFGDEARMKDLEKGWRQMLRWLVADVPDQVELRAEPAGDGQTMRIDVRVRDAKFLPVDDAQIRLRVQRSGDPAQPQPVTLTADPSPTEPGLYHTSYLPRENGGYRLEAEVVNDAGAKVAAADTGWSTDFAAAEYRSLAPDRALMEELARRTGGKVIAPSELGALARELPQRTVPLVEKLSRPLWHTPFFFLFALACLIAEWGLRRRAGLP